MRGNGVCVNNQKGEINVDFNDGYGSTINVTLNQPSQLSIKGVIALFGETFSGTLQRIP